MASRQTLRPNASCPLRAPLREENHRYLVWHRFSVVRLRSRGFLGRPGAPGLEYPLPPSRSRGTSSPVSCPTFTLCAHRCLSDDLPPDLLPNPHLSAPSAPLRSRVSLADRRRSGFPSRYKSRRFRLEFDSAQILRFPSSGIGEFESRPPFMLSASPNLYLS